MGGLWRPWAAWLLGAGRGQRRRALSARRRERPFRRLRVERLEDRSLLAATLLGTVWQDLNADGQQTGGEPAMQYAVAELFSSTNGVAGDSDDVSLGTRITDAAGNYQFTGLAAGVNHYVAIRPPVGFAFTTQDTGPDATDSDVGATGRSAMFAPVDLSTVDLDAGLSGAAPAFGWATALGDGATFELGRAMATDADGNVWLTGSFCSTFDFDPGPGVFQLASVGSNDIFVASYSATGTFRWAGRIGGSGDDQGQAVTVDSSGSVLVTGFFADTVDFDPGAGSQNLTSAGSSDVFVLKLDATGSYLWARQVGGTSNDFGYGVAVDANWNVLVTGYFWGTADFDPGAGVANLTSAGVSDSFVVKLDAGGGYQWARRVGGASDDRGNDVAVDGSGNVLVTGYFWGTADFDPGAGTANLTSAGWGDAFVFKLDAGGGYQWAGRFGGTSDDYGQSLAVDGSGNVLVTGYFLGTADFDPGAGTANLTSAGGRDAFVIKLDGGGGYQWAGRVGGASDDRGNDVAVDGSGNVLVTGYFSGTADFDPGPGTFNLTSAGWEDAFVLKLSAGGGYQWAGRIGGTSDDYGQSLAVDAGGGVLVTGFFQGMADFDPGPGVVNRTALGLSDGFLLKLTSAGDYLWAHQLGDNANLVQHDVVVDATVNVVVTGSLEGTQDFDPGPGMYSLTSGGLSDIYVARFTPGGALVWAQRIGGTDYDVAYGVAVDGSGNVLVTGYFSGTTDFDPGAGIASLTSAGGYDVFVLKLNGAGAYQWAGRVGGTSDDYGQSLAVDAADGVLVTGYFRSTVDFDPGAGTANLTSAGWVDAFVLKLDAGGGYQWARRVGGTSDDYGQSLAVDGSGNVLVTGYFWGTADFDPGAGTVNLTSAGSYDAFVLKLDAGGGYQWAGRVGGTSSDQAVGVAVDGSGNVLVTGYFSGTADFDPGAGSANLTSAGSYNAFVLKLDAGGGYQWARLVGGAGGNRGNGVAVEAGGGVLVTGEFWGTADFDPGPGVANLTSAGRADAFVLKLDAEGGYQWAGRVGGTSDDRGGDVAVDAGGVLMTGEFWGTADFDPGPGVYSLVGGANTAGFVVRLLAGQFVPEIHLVGNGQAIVSGDTTSGLGDYTDFSAALVAGGTQVRAFTIQNLGTAAVILTGTPLIHVGGPHAADFTVSVLPAGSVNEGQSTVFQITFDPSAAGLRTATVTILSNDSDEGTYTFTIQGTGLASFDSATVSGTVWHDLNLDGQQSVGDQGVQYAVVELFDTVDGVAGNADDVWLGTQVSDSNGAYQFTGLLLTGPYHIVFRPPVGFTFTVQDTGPDATDSDVSGAGLSSAYTLASGQLLDLDAGLTGAAPGFGWAARQGSAGADDGRSVTVDAAGYSYTTGQFNGTADFDPGPGTYNLTSAGFDDVYVAKYTAGGALVWARRVGGMDRDQGRGVAVDPSGSVLVTGSFWGTADFDPGAGTANLTSAGWNDAFVLKLDAAGGYQWAGCVGGTNFDYGRGVAVDAAGNVLVTGSFQGTADFDPGAGTANLTSAGSEDAFVLKLDAGGRYQWARRVGSTSGDYGQGGAVDSGGNVVVTGYFQGTADFDPGGGTVNLSSAGSHDAFVLKLDAAGGYQWAGRVGGTGSDQAVGVAVDGSGNVLVTGYFSGTADFDPGAGSANLTSAGSQDAFVLKLDAGGAYQWAGRVGGTSGDYGQGVAVDASGSVLVVGYFLGTADFDPGAGTANLTSAGWEDAFVLKLDAGGAYQWAGRVGGTSDDYGHSVTVDAGGNVLVAGRFDSTADFDPGAGAFNLTSAGGDDSFLWRLSATNFLPPIVTGVFVRGTGDGSGTGNDEWLAAYLGHLGTHGLGDSALGYRVSVGADQLDTLPWTNVDTVSIRFREGVTIASGNLQMIGAAEGPAVPSVANFSYNASTFTATWQFAAPLPANKYLLHFATGVVVGLDTFALDGEWTDGVSTQSGNGTAGGAFAFRLNVVPGDVNGDTATTQSVTNADVLQTKQALSTDVSAGAAYLFRRDVNGSGAITNADVLQVKQRLQTSIADFTDPVSPPPGESFGEESFAAGTLLDESAVAPAARLTDPALLDESAVAPNTRLAEPALRDEPAVAPTARLAEPWHTETEPWDAAASSTDAALAEPVAPSSRLTEPWHTETSGPIDLAAWDAAILAIYGKKK